MFMELAWKRLMWNAAMTRAMLCPEIVSVSRSTQFQTLLVGGSVGDLSNDQKSEGRGSPGGFRGVFHSVGPGRLRTSPGRIVSVSVFVS